MIRYLVPIGFILILLFSNPDFNFHKNQISEKISNNLDDIVLEGLAKMVTSKSKQSPFFVCEMMGIFG